MKIIFIKKEAQAQEKAQIVREILADLPEWFGLPESTQEYIKEAKKLPLWLAQRQDEVIGFVTLKETSTDSAEIHCMGVKQAFHGQGIGSQLMAALEKQAKEHYHLLQVKTVDEGHYETYDQTVSFYSKRGFKKLEVFPTLWDEWNPCLIMVKNL